MGYKFAFCILSIPFLTAANWVQSNQPPVILRPYIKNGSFNPGDFEWMKGAFPDSSLRDRKQFALVKTWSSKCLIASAAEERSLLLRFGWHTNLDGVTAGPAICSQVGLYSLISKVKTYNEFRIALSRVRPIYDAFLLGVHAASFVNNPSNNVEEQVERRALSEQMVRGATMWGSDDFANAPPLSTKEKEILDIRLNMEIIELDRDNTNWLEKVVVHSGWPRISRIGTHASQSAWLLAQHADSKPTFQLQILRYMEPLVKSHEVLGKNYAFLYDRVMLKLIGFQKYGTQLSCVSGAYKPRPLEDEKNVDAFRLRVGMNGMFDHLNEVQREYGKCS